MKTEKEEIILCDRCNGIGMVKKSELINYHNNIYNNWDEICSICNGSGRLLKKTIEETVAYKQREL